MSAPAAAGGSATSDGVSRSSALAFLALTQQQQRPEEAARGPAVSASPETLVPAGVQALLDACSAIYPNQPNPLQVTTRVKYWLGGQDPLDYISMYWNPGNEELRIPSHWHYISFGLSDLHGDGRVHPRPAAVSPTVESVSPTNESASPTAESASPTAESACPTASPSGKGIELTFRLAATSPQNAPLWPAAMMQDLARYIHATGNSIMAGDHIRGVLLGDLNLRHLLAARDPQLGHLVTNHGALTFTQLVACTGRELVAAQRGDPHTVLEAMANDPVNGCSGLLVSVVSRGSALPPARRTSNPAPLAAVTAPVLLLTPQDMEASMSVESSVGASETADVVSCLARTRETLSHSIEGGMRMSTDSFEMSSVQRALPDLSGHEEAVGLLGRVRYLSGAHVVFSREAAAMLPLAIDGRVRRGAHFTWWWARRVTLTSRHVTHAACTAPPRHMALADRWLQIYITDELAEDMSRKFAKFSRLADSEASASETEDDPRNDTERDGNTTNNPGEKDSCIGGGGTSEGDDRIVIPCTFTWPEYNLSFSVVDDLFPNHFNVL